MKYEKEQLQQTNIYCLRNIAREVGVKSPTSLKKQQLIDEIMQNLACIALVYACLNMLILTMTWILQRGMI